MPPIVATDDIRERFCAVSIERRVGHSAVVAVTEGARGTLFAAALASAPAHASAP